MSEHDTARTPWQAFIEPFANAIGKSVEEVETGLKELIGEPGEEAIELLRSEEYTPLEQLATCFGGVPTARLKKAVAQHLRATVRPEAAPAAAPAASMSFDVLPSVPDDGAWLDALKSGGELKVNSAAVIGAMRAALASRVGLYELPGLIADRMESHAEELEEPVSPDFFRLRKMLTERSYAEIFQALGVTGQFMTQKRRTALLEKLERELWPALSGFQLQLKGWAESWQQGMANPALLVGMLAANAGGAGMALPPGMMQPPATDGLRDSAEGVIQVVNRIFAGTGIPVALALAYDAQSIREVLDNPALPAQVGAANREQMLKALGVAVSSDYPRLERNATRYLLGVMELPKVTAGTEELAYCTSLMMLGSQIPWDRLAGSSASGSPRRAAGTQHTRY